MKQLVAALLLGLAATGGAAAQPSPAASAQGRLQLWRLDCGEFDFKDIGSGFSDAWDYSPGWRRKLVGSCYLIRNGDQYLLWDAGLTDRLVGRKFETPEQILTVKRSVADQLKQLGVTPQQIRFLGISHYHGDHTGQAAQFSGATLLIGEGDWEALKTNPHPSLNMSKEHLAGWLNGTNKVEPVAGDKDVFGDARVMMLAMPGHTPGHHALLVRLKSGPVLLSGDQYHFTEQVRTRAIPNFNTNRADTLASHERFDRIARNLKAKVIIQHEPADVSKLPAFPQAAE